MKISSLVKVKVCAKSSALGYHYEWIDGLVINYRADVLGGTSSSSSSRDTYFVMTTQKRGEMLVYTYSNGRISWYDEHDVLDNVDFVCEDD